MDEVRKALDLGSIAGAEDIFGLKKREEEKEEATSLLELLREGRMRRDAREAASKSND